MVYLIIACCFSYEILDSKFKNVLAYNYEVDPREKTKLYRTECLYVFTIQAYTDLYGWYIQTYLFILIE